MSAVAHRWEVNVIRRRHHSPARNLAASLATFLLSMVASTQSYAEQVSPNNFRFLTAATFSDRCDVFDAWIDLPPGSCISKAADRKCAQIAGGQKLFNENRNGKSCRGCHNLANNGSNVNGALFDVGASRQEFRRPGMPIYKLANKYTGETRLTTDPGRALRAGMCSDIDKFRTPLLRGVVAGAPYFHNGIGATLNHVVTHYEVALGFQFTPQERADSIAFMEAL